MMPISLRYVHSDRIAGLLGDFPELTEAVRHGDVDTVSFLCEWLFELNRNSKAPKPHPLSS